MLGRGAVGALVAVAVMAGPAAAVARPAHHRRGLATITMHAHPRHVTSGHAVLITGTAREPGATKPLVVDLYRDEYPYHHRILVRTARLARTGGRFAFTVHPQFDSFYRVVLVGTRAHALLKVLAYAMTPTVLDALPLGRAEVKILIFHPKQLHWAGAPIHWWFRSGTSGAWVRAPDTTSVRISPYVVMLSTTATLPAGAFGWRACFHAPKAWALEDSRNWRGCPARGYSGGGFLPVGFPDPAAIGRAESYLQSRGGITGMAVIDSEGRMSGYNIDQQFITGSVIKAMLLVAYLRRLDAMGQHYVDSYSNSFLYPMIHVSDNNAATQCWSIVGNGALYALAGAAGMTNFSITTDWGSALLTPHDQALFFFEQDSLIPPEFDAYARNLLSTIADYESWGIPAIARPLGYNVFFKGGWRPSPHTYLVNQIARLEGHGVTFSIAIMTDADSDMGDGISKIEGTTQALLG